MTLLIILHVFICFFLVAVILLQPGKGDAGVGFGSSSQTIFGSKGAGNFLTKTTSACAVVFIFTSFILTRSRIMEYSKSVISDKPAAASSKKDTSSGAASEAPKETPKEGAKPDVPPTAAPKAAQPQGTSGNKTTGVPKTETPAKK